MFTKNFAIVDIETTGGSPKTSRIIEVAVLRVEHGELVDRFESFVNPGMPIPKFITEFTGISDEDVKHAPYFEELAEELLPLFEGTVFVAHNSSFDYSFLRAEFARLGFGFTMDTLCTVRLSRALYPEHKRHNLDALINRFNFSCERRHRAFDDAKVLLDFLHTVKEQFEEPKLSKVINGVLKKHSPTQIRKEVLGTLSELSYEFERE